MVEPVQDVLEAQADESHRSLVPAWVEADKPRVSEVLERSNRVARQHEPQNRDRASTQTRQPRIDREVGLVRPDRVLEHGVQHRLLPENFGVVREPWAYDMGDRPLVAGECLIRRNRCADCDEPLSGQRHVVLVELECVGDPQVGRIFQFGVSLHAT